MELLYYMVDDWTRVYSKAAWKLPFIKGLSADCTSSLVLTKTKGQFSYFFLQMAPCQNLLRLNARTISAGAVGGAAPANGDASRDDHANGRAILLLGRIDGGRDLGRVEGGRCGRALGGTAGCTEKIQCLTGGGAEDDASTHGVGEGCTEGGGWGGSQCLANGSPIGETGPHSGGEGCRKGGALSGAEGLANGASRGTATDSLAQSCAKGGGLGRETRSEDADSGTEQTGPHRRGPLEDGREVQESSGQVTKTCGEFAHIAARGGANGSAKQGCRRPDW